MTASTCVRRARWSLALSGAARAMAWAGAVLLVGLWAGALLATIEARIAAVAASLVTLAWVCWRERFVLSMAHVALWLEERIPALRYALVTAIDPRHSAALAPRVEPLLRELEAGPVLRRAALRSAGPPALALTLAAAAFTLLPLDPVAGSGAPHRATVAVAEEAPSRLEPLRATVTPPGYAREAGHEAESFEDPALITGLAGSTVEIAGPGAAGGLGVRLGDAALDAEADPTDGESWRVVFTLPDSAEAVRLADREHRRLVVLAPDRDMRPTVQLILPARDTTVREPTGSLVLDARFMDDIGLAAASFEYIISSGDTEGAYTYREGVIGARGVDEPGVRELRHGITIPLSRFDLQPGDRLNVRAVGVDGNDWSGPGIGYSEPRTLRVAHPSEYDSLAVDAAPAAVDSTLMTLRWLIELVERLDASRADLSREAFVDSAVGFGRQTGQMRARVQQLQADHTIGGLLSADPNLEAARIALVEGEFALMVAETAEAVPHLWDALHALQEYAWAERYYLRGEVPDILVDLARVRLTGTETGRAAPRQPRAPTDTMRTRWRSMYARAVGATGTSPDSAYEALAMLQVEALRSDPMLAAALGDAVAAIRAGADPTPALERARVLLDGPAVASDTLPRWGGVW